MQGRYDLQLERTILPDSYSGIQMDLLVERFVNLAALYVDSLDLITVNTLLEAVRTDLAQEADVTLRVIEQHEIGRTGYYFIYLAYAMMAIMVLAVTSLMIVFNKQDLRRRNLSAPLKLSHFNLQLIFGGIVFALIVWLVMSLLSLTVGGATLRPAERAFLWLNALVFTFACMSISFLIGQFVRSRNVQPAIANVLALGTSFISGVFVPQSMLGKPVHTLASFTPTYWYVRAINEISALSTISAESLRPVTGYLLIQVGFIAAFLTVAMVIAKQRQQTAS
jgi:ABC-2 type transport system permease protein